MENISRSQFEEKKSKSLYHRLTLVKTYNNGSEDFAYDGECPRCLGRGIVFTHVLNGVPVPAIPDSGICYKCGGTRKVTTKIHVVPDEIFDAKKAKAELKAKGIKEMLIKRHIEEGYKKVDFSMADWFVDFNARLFKDAYYRIVKETEKAVLVSFLKELDFANDYSVWMPKKAIVR